MSYEINGSAFNSRYQPQYHNRYPASSYGQQSNYNRSQPSNNSDLPNNYTNRLATVSKGSEKNLGNGAVGMACGVFKVILGIILLISGILTVALSSHSYLGSAAIVTGVVLGLVGTLQALLESLRFTAGAARLIASPLIAMDPSTIDPKRTEINFRWKKQ